ncbi:MAG: ABC transporter ATP-binding protein [Acidobacteria bacterium]|nr:ABC transporter ATP-binding protein [Acidobacteriota bacterium]
MTAAFLRVEGVRIGYGPVEVIRSVSFGVARGETFAIIGPNGAGKTTLFRAVTGETPVSAGRISLDGRDITRLPVHLRARAGIGRTFQVARVFQGLSVLANVIASVESRLRGAGQPCGPWYAWRPSREVTAEASGLLAELGLAAAHRVEARFLSHGDRKRLEIALALAQRPSTLMLDEPTAGMSHADRLAIVDLLRRLRRDKGVTVVMTEHDMDVIFGLADRILVLNHGEVIATGTPEQVRADPLVREVYLGKEMVHADAA